MCQFSEADKITDRNFIYWTITYYCNLFSGQFQFVSPVFFAIEPTTVNRYTSLSNYHKVSIHIYIYNYHYYFFNLLSHLTARFQQTWHVDFLLVHYFLSFLPQCPVYNLSLDASLCSSVFFLFLFFPFLSLSADATPPLETLQPFVATVTWSTLSDTHSHIHVHVVSSSTIQ